MTKHTEQEVREFAESQTGGLYTVKMHEMLTAYADLLAAKRKAKCMLTDAELADPEYVRAYIEGQSEVINDLLAAQPVEVPDGWRDAVSKLVFAARTSGGTAGRDEVLCKSCDDVEAMLAAAQSPASEGAKLPPGFHNCKWYKDSPPPGVVVESEQVKGAKVAQPDEVLSDELESYDAGLFGDYGGGNVEWWHDYMRAELARAHDFYADQFARAAIAASTKGGE